MANTKNIVQTADELAQSKGAANAASLIDDINSRISTANAVSQDAALQAASDFISKLTLLTLKQQIDGEYNMGAYDYVNKFENIKMPAGNSMQFQRKILTGNESYNANNFIPTKLSEPSGDVTNISLYQTDGTTLSTYGYQYKKGVTLQRQKWLPYFTSGSLQKFLSETVDAVNQSYYLFRVSMIEKMILAMKPTRTESSGQYTLTNNQIQKNVVGTASNLLTSFTQEIFPLINKMRFLSSEYNLNLNGTSTSLNSTSKNKLIMLVNTNTYTKLTHGVIANVFNAELVKPDNFISTENIFQVNKQISVPTDENSPITMLSTDLLGEDEIIVLEADAIKSLYWINDVEEQHFGQNMTTQLTLHVWGALGFIPWGMGFYYTNKNMAILPTA